MPTRRRLDRTGRRQSNPDARDEHVVAYDARRPPIVNEALPTVRALETPLSSTAVERDAVRRASDAMELLP